MAVPWDSLPEEFRESNRNQARQIHEKLDTLKYGVLPIGMAVPETVTVFPEEQVEFLAKMEHDRWMEWHLSQGWQWGEKKDPAKLTEEPEIKTHPCLIAYAKLNDKERNKDRNSIRHYPDFADAAGMKIVDVQTA